MTKTAEAKWRALIAAQGKSGLSVREFAAQRGKPPVDTIWSASFPQRRSSA